MKNIAIIAAVALVAMVGSTAEAQSMNGRMRLTGTMAKNFDSCDVGAASRIAGDLRVSWNTYVNFSVKDKVENLATSAVISNNAVAGRQVYPLRTGGYVEYGILIQDFHKISRRTPSPKATKFFTFLNNAGQAVCQMSYQATMRRN